MRNPHALFVTLALLAGLTVASPAIADQGDCYPAWKVRGSLSKTSTRIARTVTGTGTVETWVNDKTRDWMMVLFADGKGCILADGESA